MVVPVKLSAAPQRPLSIPITFSYLHGGTADDHMCTGAPVVFAATDTTRNMTCRIVQDTIPDHAEVIQTNFGTLPPGVILGHVDDLAVQIVVIDDDPAVTVSFAESTYSVDENDSLTVTLTLSEDPMRSLTIPITATGQSGAIADDYTDPGSVTFSSGDMSQTFSFSPVDDDEDDDGEKVRLAFGSPLPPGVSAGSTSSTTISINDDDDPQVKVQFGSATYSITEPGSVTVKLTLDADPEREVVIPLSAAYGNDATSADFSGVASSVTFDSGDTSKTFSVSTGDDFIDRNGRSATLSFGSLPARVTEGELKRRSSASRTVTSGASMSSPPAGRSPRAGPRPTR